MLKDHKNRRTNGRFSHILRRKEKELTFAQIVGRFKPSFGQRYKLSKETLTINIDGINFEFIDIPLKN